MKSRKQTTLLLILIPLLFVACGSANPSVGAAPGNALDKLQIEMNHVTNDPPSILTVENEVDIQKLHDTAQALPKMPTNQVCTMMAGPRYELTFFEAENAVSSITADKGGCGTVTVRENDVRLASKDFWQLLDQVIADAQPEATTDKLQIVLYEVNTIAPTTVTVQDKELVQKLYKSARNLPRLPENQPCPEMAGPRYALIFSEGENDVANATADQSGCGTVTFEKGSIRQADTAFWQLLTQALEGKTPEKIKPDSLQINTAPVTGDPSAAVSSTMVQDVALIQQLYDTTLALPEMPQDQICTKQAGPRYELSFSQDNKINILSVTADKGGCGTVTFMKGDVRLASEEFWQLLDRARA